MTNKMRLIFVIATSLSAAFSVLISTQFAIDTADHLLSAVANALGLHEAPTLSALAVLVIPGLYLYLALGQRRHSVGEQNKWASRPLVGVEMMRVNP